MFRSPKYRAQARRLLVRGGDPTDYDRAVSLSSAHRPFVIGLAAAFALTSGLCRAQGGSQFRLIDLLHEDCTVILAGDSFAAPLSSRLPTQLMLRAAEAGVPIVGLGGGAMFESHIVQGIVDDGVPERAVASGNYSVNGGVEFLSLPLRGVREVTATSATHHATIRLQADTWRLAPGPVEFAPIAARSRDVIAYLLDNTLVPVAPGPPEFVGLGSLGVVRDGPYIDVSVRLAGDHAGARAYLAGGMFYIPGAHGVRYTNLSDTSWSYYGFADRRTPSWVNDKIISSPQLKSWIAALPRHGRIVVLWHLANERFLDPDAVPDQFSRMADLMFDDLAEVGYHDVEQVFILPYAHVVATRYGPEWWTKAREGMVLACSRSSRVHLLDVHRATAGLLLDGSPDGLAAASQLSADWGLPEPAGPILDDLVLHPTDEGAVWLSRLIWNWVVCPMDLDGTGSLSTNDFFRFLEYYSAADPRADFTEDEQVDSNDFFAFLSGYQGGC